MISGGSVEYLALLLFFASGAGGWGGGWLGGWSSMVAVMRFSYRIIAFSDRKYVKLCCNS